MDCKRRAAREHVASQPVVDKMLNLREQFGFEDAFGVRNRFGSVAQEQVGGMDVERGGDVDDAVERGL